MPSSQPYRTFLLLRLLSVGVYRCYSRESIEEKNKSVHEALGSRYKIFVEFLAIDFQLDSTVVPLFTTRRMG